MTTRTIFRPHKFFLIMCTLSLASVLFAGEIHDAAIKGDAERVKALIAANPELVNADFGDGRTPLYFAAQKGHIEIVKILVKDGANLNATDDNDDTPLEIAMDENHADVVTLLLESGVNHSDGLFEKWPVLHWAATKGHKGIIQWLIKNGTDPNLRNEYEMTALQRAAQNEQKQIAILLLDAGADVNAKGKGSYTALYYALRERDWDLVELLLERGADVGAESIGGAVVFATENRNLFDLLLARGADINGGKNPEWTPLGAAVEMINIERIRFLLAAGADVNARDSEGRTALHKLGSQGEPFRTYNEEIARLLIEEGASANITDQKGYTPLHMAVGAEEDLFVRMLLKAGADPTIKTLAGVTPVGLAERSPRILDIFREFSVPGLPPYDLEAEWDMLAQNRAWSCLLTRLSQVFFQWDECSGWIEISYGVRDPAITEVLDLLNKDRMKDSPFPWGQDIYFGNTLILEMQDFNRVAQSLDKPINRPKTKLVDELNKIAAEEMKSWCEGLASTEGAEEKAVKAALEKAEQQERNKQYDAAMATLYEVLRHRSQVKSIRSKILELRQEYEKMASVEDRHNTAQHFVKQGQKFADLEARINAYCMSLANEESAEVLAFLRRSFDEARVKLEPPSLPKSFDPLPKELMEASFKYLRSASNDNTSVRFAANVAMDLTSSLVSGINVPSTEAFSEWEDAMKVARLRCKNARAENSVEAWRHAQEACMVVKDKLEYIEGAWGTIEKARWLDELLAECAKHVEE